MKIYYTLVKRAIYFAETYVLLLVSELHRTSIKWPYVLFIYLFIFVFCIV